MGRRIDEDTIIRINEVYLECGVKSKTAQIVGVSPSTVTKYLIPNYVSQKVTNETPIVFDKEIKGVSDFISNILATMNSKNCGAAAAFCEICKLTPEEWAEVEEIQKGIMI